MDHGAQKTRGVPLNRAAIDPGSRWIAVTITRDDGPASPCNFLDARCFEVVKHDHLVTYDPPQRRLKPLRPVGGVPAQGPLLSYLVTEERVQSPDEKRATDAARLVVGDDVGAYLTAWGVEACDIETVERVFAQTAQGAAAAGDAIRIGAVIVERALTIWELSRTSRGLKAPRVPVLATTWRARVVPLIKALLVRDGKPVKGVLIRGKGAALEPVLSEHVPGWPGGSRWSDADVEHIRDSTGLALACGLPALPSRAKGTQGPRVRKPRDASKGAPRGSRARALMGPIDLEKYRKTAREYVRAVREAARPARVAAREAKGCSCRAPGASLRGRHKRSCALHRVKMPHVPGIIA